MKLFTTFTAPATRQLIDAPFAIARRLQRGHRSAASGRRRWGIWINDIDLPAAGVECRVDLVNPVFSGTVGKAHVPVVPHVVRAVGPQGAAADDLIRHGVGAQVPAWGCG